MNTNKPAVKTGSLIENVIALYGAHFCNYILPLVTVPYCVRVLGPKSWGMVAFAQALGVYTGLIVEYGFSLSAVREVARNRDSKEELSILASGVLGARMVLLSGSVALALAVEWLLPEFRQQRLILWGGMVWGTAGALSPMWFFQGLERMRAVASVDVLARLTTTAAIFVTVHSAADAWRVLMAMSAGALVSTAAGFVLIYREVDFRFPSPKSVVEALQCGWTMFLFRSSAILYTSGNAFILGLFAPPEVVGYFAGAEKMVRALLGLFNPLNQATFPRINHLVKHLPDSAARFARWNFRIMLTAGTVMGLVTLVAAPNLVLVFLGKQLAPSIAVVRVLSLLLPLVATNIAVGMQWIIPLKLDRPFNVVVLVAGLVNIGLAAVLAPRFAQIGMAWAVVAAETVATTGLYIVLRRAGIDILRLGQGEASSKEDNPAVLATVEN